MKSALEIAMEKSACVDKNEPVLTDTQKEKLNEVRNIHRGKIAEAEIMFKSELDKFQGAAQESDVRFYLDEKRKELALRKRELELDLERKLQEIREHP